METLKIVLEAAAIAFALSVDAFAAGFAYGTRQIRLPWRSALVINLICSAIVGLSLGLGSLAALLLSPGLRKGLCFGVLFALGLVKLLDGITRWAIRRYGNLDGQLGFSLFSLRFVLHVYADPAAVDLDHSKTISAAEAASLALALSLDGAAAGFGAAMGQASIPTVVAASLIANQLTLTLGSWLGERLSRKLRISLGWLGGIILLFLAFSKL
ncbi:MAG: sporulation membrane protein YtaF [Lachnospiraceae bacterium]|nr:sporulation membrane protein YtaF [Lachnospiraceae bacterium]